MVLKFLKFDFEQDQSIKFKSGVVFTNLRKDKFNDFYQTQGQLGEGAFGTVYKCLKKSDSSMRAVKVIKKSGQSKDDQDNFLRETQILREISHPNIIRIYDMFEDDKSYYMVTELCQGGDLFSKIEQQIQNQKSLSEKEAASIIEQILLAINTCHKNNICHRDLKPENILFNQDGTIKVIDFGTAKKIDPQQGIQGITGTPYYVAPEVIEKANYNEKCDIWSIGVIMYILLTGEPPFNGSNDNQIFNKIKMGNFDLKPLLKRKLSGTGKELINRMLVLDPAKRITAEEALNHKWVQQFKIENYQNLDSEASDQILKNLTNFSRSQKFKRVVFSFIASQTSNTEHREAEALFNKLDANKDGKLTKEELIQGYRPIFGQLTEAKVDEILYAADLDGNGSIDYNEWRTATLKFNSKISTSRVKEAFNYFDKDKSGSISTAELREALGGATGYELSAFDKLIKEVDSDGNGEIDFEEFKKMMESLSGENVVIKK